MQRWQYHIDTIDVSGLENLQALLDDDAGVLIASNHVSYPDPFILATAADLCGVPFYYMTAWQVFGTSPWIKREMLRRLGCFSVNREGSDVAAFRSSVEILSKRPNPLVIFPEGEMYHTNDLVMPFHKGVSAIALSAARKAKRRIAVLPCALRYEYTTDPTTELKLLTDQLEARLFLRPRSDLPLIDRVRRLAEAALSLKEIELMGTAQKGAIAERLHRVCLHILDTLECAYELVGDSTIPERVKAIREQIIRKLRQDPSIDDQRRLQRDLDDVFLAVQLFSYPGGYLDQRPSIGRLSETLDKLEEDILGVPHARVRGRRQATLRIGQPVNIETLKRSQPSVEQLTKRLERDVQCLLDSDWKRDEDFASDSITPVIPRASSRGGVEDAKST